LSEALFVLGLFVLFAGTTPFWPRAALVANFFDDAFYYFQVARNLATGHGFTFDGLHATNGFHPLWLFVVTPLFRLLPGDTAPLRAIVVLQCLLAALAAAQLARTLAPRTGRAAAAAAALLLLMVPSAPVILRTGLESSLCVFLLVEIWRRWLAMRETESPPTGAWLVLGLVCALAFLARLEAAVAVPCVALLSLGTFRRRPGALVAFVALPSLTAALYLLWNRLSFGLWLPVSGAVKSGPLPYGEPASGVLERLVFSPWPYRRMIWFLLPSSLSNHADAVYLSMAAVALVAALIWRRRLARILAHARVGLLLLICAALWIVEAVLLGYGGQWYAHWSLLALVAVVGPLLGEVPRLARVAVVALFAVGVGHALQAGWHVAHAPPGVDSRWLAAADWARAHVGDDEPMGSWNAGIFTWFSHRHVINLDGLANDAHYYRRVVLGGQLADYLREERVTWIADEAVDASETSFPANGFATGELISQLRLKTVVTFCEAPAPAPCHGYVIWRLER
jgi:hypothetical protein